MDTHRHCTIIIIPVLYVNHNCSCMDSVTEITLNLPAHYSHLMWATIKTFFYQFDPDNSCTHHFSCPCPSYFSRPKSHFSNCWNTLSSLISFVRPLQYVVIVLQLSSRHRTSPSLTIILHLTVINLSAVKAIPIMIIIMWMQHTHNQECVTLLTLLLSSTVYHCMYCIMSFASQV